MATSVVFRTVVRTLLENGQDVMAPGVMVWRDHNVDIRTRSRLIVESNQKAIVRIQGQITQVFEPGFYDLSTPNTPVTNFFSRLGYGGNVPWTVEAIFFSLSRFEARTNGVSQTSELIPLIYQVAYYFQITDPVKLIQAVQLNGAFYTVNDLSVYVSPIIDQAVSQVLNAVSIKDLYSNLQKISESVSASLRSILNELGINLIISRVIRIEPEDETMRRIVQLTGMGIDMNTAIRARLSEIMALKSDPAATNMFLGTPYFNMYILPMGQSPQVQAVQQSTDNKQKKQP
ncbi:MAG: SPFH domain-containing protein [Thermoplasmata archaeon]|nr:SPFH domain-containing protein [Thermoplasmata archaeon]